MAIIPEVTDLTRPYWAAAAQRRLVVQSCAACGASWHPPLPRCPHCHSAGLGWREVAGTGTVYTYTVVTHPTHAALADKVPYVVAIVELTDGPRLVTAITGCEPGAVRCGLPVRVRFTPVTDEITLPCFEPAPEPAPGMPASGTPAAPAGPRGD